MSERLTRKEMKQDELATAAGRAADWLEAHAQNLIKAAVVIVVAALLAVGVFLYRQAQQERAAELLGEALRIYEAPVVEAGATPDDPRDPSFISEDLRRERARELFEAVFEGYRRTRAGDVAAVFLGKMAIEVGEVERAEELWSRFVQRRDGHLLAATVRLNLIGIKREQGRGEEVVEELRALLARDRKPLPEDVLLWELSMTLKGLGREEEAVASLQRLVDELPQSPFAAEAQTYLDTPGPPTQRLPPGSR